MKRGIGFIVAVCIGLLLQSCFVKTSPNMAFIHKGDISRNAEVVSVKVPGILMRTFILGELREMKEEDPMLAMALKKIKSIKLTAIEGEKGHRLHERFTNYLADQKFEELMSIYSDGAKVSINTLTKGDRIKKIMLGVVDNEDQVFIELKSDMSLSELNQLVDHYETTKGKEKKDKKKANAEELAFAK